jgi:hypothetical protein
MKRRTLITIIGIAAVLVSLSNGLFGQEQYKIVQDKFTLKIEGTSNLHDWNMKAENISGDVQANVKNSLVKDFSTGDIHVQVEKLESGKRIMNNKTYDALESNDHPKISFQLRSVENLYAAGSRFSGKAKGKLTIAGNSKMVTIPFSGKMNGNDEFSVNGDYSLKMSEYGVEPPSAMLGSLKTGDEVTIKYKMTFKEKSGMLTTKNK